MDAIFAVKLALQKRHEHNLGTWAVLINLIKGLLTVFLATGCMQFWRNSACHRSFAA
jgi:hypothetical protein